MTVLHPLLLLKCRCGTVNLGVGNYVLEIDSGFQGDTGRPVFLRPGEQVQGQETVLMVRFSPHIFQRGVSINRAEYRRMEWIDWFYFAVWFVAVVSFIPLLLGQRYNDKPYAGALMGTTLALSIWLSEFALWLLALLISYWSRPPDAQVFLIFSTGLAAAFGCFASWSHLHPKEHLKPFAKVAISVLAGDLAGVVIHLGFELMR